VIGAHAVGVTLSNHSAKEAAAKRRSRGGRERDYQIVHSGEDQSRCTLYRSGEKWWQIIARCQSVAVMKRK